MEQHEFHPTILRAYDIRGIYQQTLTIDDAKAIGRSFAAILAKRNLGNKVAVGRDGRISSPALAEALIAGLVDGGAEVFDIGFGPTPMLYFANVLLQTDGAIQVTGSHNPPTHNGFKMVMDNASFFGPDIDELGAMSKAGIAKKPGGGAITKSIFDDYVARLTKDADVGDVSVIWDCGNGASGPATAAMVASLSGTHSVMFEEIDGTFPNHHPNPVDPETLEILRNAVASKNADLGIGFDGDGDRIGIIDAKGRMVPGDILTAYLAQDVASRNPGKPIILDVKSSDVAMQQITASGAEAQIWKTGHSHMKKRMKEIGAPMAGEMSGHIFIADQYYGFDDALYVGIRVISQMHKSGVSITDYMDQLPVQHATPELHIQCDDEVKFGVMERLSAYVLTQRGADQTSLIDGVRVRDDEGWWLVRASNTEAALVARAEADNPAALKRLITEMEIALGQAEIKWQFS